MCLCHYQTAAHAPPECLTFVLEILPEAELLLVMALVEASPDLDGSIHQTKYRKSKPSNFSAGFGPELWTIVPGMAPLAELLRIYAMVEASGVVTSALIVSIHQMKSRKNEPSNFGQDV